MKFKFDWFLWGMIIAVALAWVFPGPGAQGGWLHPELVNKLGVALIFFLNGVALSFAALKEGTLRWPLHLVVQATTFLLFPLIGWAAIGPVTWAAGANLALGFFFLCALPSTVSSSVAMTAAAKGNVPAAVFNATLSSLIGVFLTPFWVSLVLGRGQGVAMDLGDVILDLVLWLLLPLLLGQLARPWLGDWAKRHKAALNYVDRGTILFIIYTSFCDSVVGGLWQGQGLWVIVGAVVGSALLFAIVFGLVNAACLRFGFTLPDRVAAVFCGSKKTIASGVPMAQLIFAGDPRLGVLLLPLMIYHPLQLIICGALANHWAAQAKSA